MKIIVVATCLLTLCQGIISTACSETVTEQLPIVPGYHTAAQWSRDAIEAVRSFSQVRRALPNAPDGYTPEGGNCPSTRPSVRSADTLSSHEISWLEMRRSKTVGAMRDLLGRLNITNFDVEKYFTLVKKGSDMPTIAIAVSGGGYRAMMNGAGAVAAFDNRTMNSTSSGQLGGLLQCSTYLSGLSGGAWLVGSMFVNNFTTVPALLSDNAGVWELENSIFQGPPSVSNYYQQLINAVSDKSKAGFGTSITDYWGRALSYQFINASDGGPAYTWSSIALESDFMEANMPMPIVIADERAPGEKLIASNTTIFEFNPWEFGTWDPTTNAFIALEYLGSNFSAGMLPAKESCVRGFDNAGFVMGTSSSLFNQALLQINNTDIRNALKKTITAALTSISEANNDISLYAPNPFYHYNNNTNDNAQSTTLFLVDGGEDLQNVPFHPLLQSKRHVNVIFAIDSSADTIYNWPNGTSLVATYHRSLNTSGIGNQTPFPPVPDQNTFVNLGLNTHPTFFGCNTSNMANPPPLIVYIPNSPYVYYSNVSTFDLQYNNTERNAIVQNGYDGATMANGTKDPEWPACVGCAILSRSLTTMAVEVPVVCQQCFNRYCWDGTINSTTPLPYNPKITLTPSNVQSGAATMSPVANEVILLALLVAAFWIVF